jgi:hypothetical protein
MGFRDVHDVEPEFEEERRKRMYNMLRHSKAYKKRQVQRANLAWQDEVTTSLPNLSLDLSGLGLEKTIGTQPSQGGLFAMDQLDQALSEFNSTGSELSSLSLNTLSTTEKKRVSFDEKVVVIDDGNGVGAVSHVLELHDEVPNSPNFEERESPPPPSPLSPLDPELINDPEVELNERLIAAAKRSPNLPPLPGKRRWANSPPMDKLSKLLAGLGLMKNR